MPIFAFVTGYGLYYKYSKDSDNYNRQNLKRVGKLYINYWIILLLFAVLLGVITGKEGYPGNWQKFLLNWTGLEPS